MNIKRKKGPRLLSLALSLILMLGLLPRLALAAPTITTANLPGGHVGAPYRAALTATSAGGQPGALTWSITEGDLPGGLTLDQTTGVISGTPTASGVFPFTVTAEDGDGQTSQACSITIQALEEVLIANHTAGQLENEVTAQGAVPGDIKSLTVSGGALDAADFTFLRTGCTALEQLDLSESATAEVPDGALDNGPTGANGGLDNLSWVKLPDTVIRIGNRAFFGCAALERADLRGLKTLGESAFEGCTGLTLDLGSLRALEGPALAARAFAGCVSLAGAALPPTVSELGDGAFASIPNLTLALTHDGVVTIGANTFQGGTGLTVRTPAGQLGDYQADPVWAGLLAQGNAALRPMPPGAVAESGYILAPENGATFQRGNSLGEGDYSFDGTDKLLFHPRENRELLLSGGIPAHNFAFSYYTPERRSIRARLDGPVNANSIGVGCLFYPTNETMFTSPTDLALNGGGYTITTTSTSGGFTVYEASRADITGGLTIDGNILLIENAVLRAGGPFAQTDGHTVRMAQNALLELREEPSAEWLDRLEYMPTILNPDGQARAVFADGTFLVDQNGVTRLPEPPPPGGDGGSSGPSYGRRTLTDRATGVAVSGSRIHDSARLEVEPRMLHEAGDAGCALLQAADKAGRVISLYGVSLTRPFRGSVTVSIPAAGRDGEALTVAHCLEGKLALTDVTVKEGMAAVETQALSPFAVLDGVYTQEALEALARPAVELPFTDVSESDWFYGDAAYAYGAGLMTGTSGATFSPGGAATRAQLAAILHRLEGSPSSRGEGGAFTDVPENAWYAPASAWCAERGFMGGYGDGRFGPNDPITREQLVTTLYRCAQYQGRDVSAGEDANILSYADAMEVSPWAVEAFRWACGAGIVEGSGGRLDPQAGATRAQLAAVLRRFAEPAAGAPGAL